MREQSFIFRLRRAVLALGTAAGLAGGIILAGNVPADAADLPQVTFSATGASFGLSGGSTTPFGFWIWCDAGPASSYGDCSGSMYFYALSPQTVPVTGSITSPAANTYAMTVAAPPTRAFPDGVSCTLTNTPPVTPGPTNTVTAFCTSPAGSGIALNAVVAVSTG
jgi:hypothetical protein